MKILSLIVPSLLLIFTLNAEAGRDSTLEEICNATKKVLTEKSALDRKLLAFIEAGDNAHYRTMLRDLHTFSRAIDRNIGGLSINRDMMNNLMNVDGGLQTAKDSILRESKQIRTLTTPTSEAIMDFIQTDCLDRLIAGIQDLWNQSCREAIRN